MVGEDGVADAFELGLNVFEDGKLVAEGKDGAGFGDWRVLAGGGGS